MTSQPPQTADGAQLLPFYEREALMRAAQTPGDLERLAAIERELERLRRLYPDHFKLE